MQDILVNVLSPATYEDCHIPGSLNIPLADLESKSEQWVKKQPIIVYCASYECPASRRAWHLLNNLGFSQVRAYEGGMREWVQKGFPAQGNCSADYLKSPNKKSEQEDKQVKTISAEELHKLIMSA